MRYLLFLFLALISNAYAERQTRYLHALVVTDTISPTIEPGTSIDRLRMKKSLLAIAKHIHYKPHITVLSGKKTSRPRILKWIASLKNTHKDIVLFYFSGHGERSSSRKESFPVLAIPAKSRFSSMKFLKGRQINKLLLKKHPRFCLSIFDCCNSSLPYKSLFNPKKIRPLIFPKKGFFPGLKSLFCECTGFIGIIAAPPGQNAITATSGCYRGSFLTSGLLHGLIQEGKNSSASWEMVCKNSSQFIATQLRGKQRPIYFIMPKNAPAITISSTLKKPFPLH
jgi:hypothetical protein